MAWEFLASTVLTSSGDTIDSGTIDARINLFIQVCGIADGNLDACVIRFNGDSNSNYAVRKSNNGGGSDTNVNETGMNYMSANGTDNHYATFHVMNFANKEKLLNERTIRQGSGVTAPNRKEMSGKWVNTSDSITSVQAVNRDGSGDYASGSYLNVFGSN